ncbi:hypothetical protein HK104_009750 [Borealophlyctis nickersoniae]|nr:hypothetical protein HK104_009750 [Borealophlyctis nickersoniae]
MLRATYVPRDLAFPSTTTVPIVSEDEMATQSSIASGRLTPNYVFAIQAAGKLPELNGIINTIFPDIGTLHLRTYKAGIRLWFQRGDTYTPWHAEGSGVAVTLTIFAAILYDRIERFRSMENFFQDANLPPYHYVIALDEPTASLHPLVFPAFMKELEKIDVEIVIATHSVHFLLSTTSLPAHLDALKAVLASNGREEMLAKFDELFKQAVKLGKSKLAEEFGTAISLLKSNKEGAKLFLEGKDIGDLMDGMRSRLETFPEELMDAKWFLQRLGLYELKYWRQILNKMGKERLHEEIKRSVRSLFDWAGV